MQHKTTYEAKLLRRVLGPAAVFVLALAAVTMAHAEVTVTPSATGYDVDVTGQASSTELIDAIVAATGVRIGGTPEETTFNANRLRSASLERVLRVLLPRAGFVVRSTDDGKPDTIIFMAKPGAGSEPGAGPDGSEAVLPEPGLVDQPPDNTDPASTDPSATDATMPDAGAPDLNVPSPILPDPNLPDPNGRDTNAPDASAPVDGQDDGS